MLAIFGQMETESLKEILVLSICFLIMAILSGVICKLGFRCKGKAPKRTINKTLSEPKENIRAERNDPPEPQEAILEEKQPVSAKRSEKKATMQAAMETFPPEKQKQFEAQFYQYTQDVGCGGLEPEIAAANRGLVFVDGRPVHVEVAARMRELERQYAAEQQTAVNAVYQRAHKLYEAAGPHRRSLLDAEA